MCVCVRVCACVPVLTVYGARECDAAGARRRGVFAEDGALTERVRVRARRVRQERPRRQTCQNKNTHQCRHPSNRRPQGTARKLADLPECYFFEGLHGAHAQPQVGPGQTGWTHPWVGVCLPQRTPIPFVLTE